MDFYISDKINEICESISAFDKINICPYENTTSPGSGRIEFKNGVPEIVIGINKKYPKYFEQVLSHELIHFKLASDRNFIFGFDNNFNETASLILSAFEHPSIIETQKSMRINVFDFLKIDLDFNLPVLNNKIKSKNMTLNDLILLSDRFCWDVFPSKIKITKSLVKTLHDEYIKIINKVTSEINIFKSCQTPEQLISGINSVFEFININHGYEVKYLK